MSCDLTYYPTMHTCTTNGYHNMLRSPHHCRRHRHIHGITRPRTGSTGFGNEAFRGRGGRDTPADCAGSFALMCVDCLTPRPPPQPCFGSWARMADKQPNQRMMLCMAAYSTVQIRGPVYN